jgi:hypothetical protein
MPKQVETVNYQIRLEVVKTSGEDRYGSTAAKIVHEFLCLAIHEQDQIAWDWLRQNVSDVELFMPMSELD